LSSGCWRRGWDCEPVARETAVGTGSRWGGCSLAPPGGVLTPPRSPASSRLAVTSPCQIPGGAFPPEEYRTPLGSNPTWRACLASLGWRRGWDSNPRTGSPGKTLSRRLPYGHSGTPPQGLDYSMGEGPENAHGGAPSGAPARSKSHACVREKSVIKHPTVY
jgi:hypothetical protein